MAAALKLSKDDAALAVQHLQFSWVKWVAQEGKSYLTIWKLDLQ
jgi:hypothetical protein